MKESKIIKRIKLFFHKWRDIHDYEWVKESTECVVCLRWKYRSFRQCKTCGKIIQKQGTFNCTHGKIS